MKPRTLLVFVSLLAVSLCAKANPLRKYIDELQSNKLSDYATVVLLDSTSVSVSPTGQGVFSVVKGVKVQNLNGVMANRILKYDYDPLTAAARFKVVKIYHEDGSTTDVDVSKACDYTAPARAIYW